MLYCFLLKNRTISTVWFSLSQPCSLMTTLLHKNKLMLLTWIAHLALIKTALIMFGSFRAGVIWKNFYLALINSCNHFSRVKYLSSYMRVIRYFLCVHYSKRFAFFLGHRPFFKDNAIIPPIIKDRKIT